MLKFKEYELNETWKPYIPSTISSKVYSNRDTSNLILKDKLPDKYFPKKEEFLKKVIWIAEQFNVPANWLMAVMDVETGGRWEPFTDSTRSSAQGLIQMNNGTARGTFGLTSSKEIPKDPIRQLDYVLVYLQRFIGDKIITDPLSFYIIIFSPGYYYKSMTTPYSNTIRSGNSTLFNFFPENSPLKGTKLELYIMLIKSKKYYQEMYINGDFNNNVEFIEEMTKLGLDKKIINKKKKPDLVNKQNSKRTQEPLKKTPKKTDLKDFVDMGIEYLKSLTIGDQP
jgi:hypothetical protein